MRHVAASLSFSIGPSRNTKRWIPKERQELQIQVLILRSFYEQPLSQSSIRYYYKNIDCSCFNHFTSDKFCPFKAPCEGEQAARGNNCIVRSVFFFFTADFIAYVLYLRYTKSDMYKLRTPFWRDVIETILHSEGLIEERFFTKLFHCDLIRHPFKTFRNVSLKNFHCFVFKVIVS